MTAIRLSSTVYLAAIARIAEEWSPSPSAVFGELLTSQPRVEYRRAPRFRIAKGWASTATRITFGR